MYHWPIMMCVVYKHRCRNVMFDPSLSFVDVMIFLFPCVYSRKVGCVCKREWSTARKGSL